MTDLSLIRTYEVPEILIRENDALKSKNKILISSLIVLVIVGISYIMIQHSEETN